MGLKNWETPWHIEKIFFFYIFFPELFLWKWVQVANGHNLRRQIRSLVQLS